MLYRQNNIIEGRRKDLDESRKIANEAHTQPEERAQYIRRDCLQISGIAPNEELSREGVVRSVGNAIDLSVSDIPSILISFASYSQFQYYSSTKDNCKIYKRGNPRSILI